MMEKNPYTNLQLQILGCTEYYSLHHYGEKLSDDMEQVI
jgi:hypothetical protein